ncbi:MAG: hypothetical protein ABH889_00805 [Candidatus Portnoybacteria bacterium]
MKIQPFSDNIIFYDSEFTSLDPYKGEILSIGLVKMNGEELYLELEYDGEVSNFVKDNVLPYLKGEKVSRDEARDKIREFIDGKESYLVAYIDSYDSIYWNKLFKIKDSTKDDQKPAFWMTIDFASILFGLGIDPEAYNYQDKKNFYKKIGVDASKYKEHNALDDARLLREVYLRFYQLINKVIK